MRSCALLVLLVGVAGCWVNFPDERFARGDARGERPGTRDQGVPDQQVSDLLKCTANAPVSCTPDKKGFLRCNASGFGTVAVNCAPYGCLDQTRHCDGCTPGDPPKCGDSIILVTCTEFGLPETKACEKGCRDGACL